MAAPAPPKDFSIVIAINDRLSQILGRLVVEITIAKIVSSRPWTIDPGAGGQ